MAKAHRLRFTAEEKLRSLEKAETCEPNELEAVLRRVGIDRLTPYQWHADCDRRAFAALKNQTLDLKSTEPGLEQRRLADEEEDYMFAVSYAVHPERFVVELPTELWNNRLTAKTKPSKFNCSLHP